jgi:hypothetical protein
VLILKVSNPFKTKDPCVLHKLNLVYLLVEEHLVLAEAVADQLKLETDQYVMVQEQVVHKLVLLKLYNLI